ncbi:MULTISPECIES: phenylacetic acid degradation bifunctional protein PaaZ [unclassified Oceanobacter]|uniref:phenylacetic acid degradation bifunctional protein PaaZ n=1 Tax=unclassified Oceanobacter TaxID=2620260 RepID=UPI002736F7F5|nr:MULTISPECIES: phenylacetic acid degradation bifunctional protein PaaZ [unclassified Oceanobacter]MDP2609069.1 phenylacetic acid degradation bifunctional protein PaaZ [Oceanobacter sp. 1_MG-2023]MDP2612391.1 phenylacetic acid degradation bifunctional protein PaaZ [Oceanobacter sp. 2_MG-2023]
MNQLPTLQSFIAGQWIGATAASPLTSAVNGKPVYHTHAETIDFEQSLDFARCAGQQSLLAMDFQSRAACLRALGKYLIEHKEALYAISAHSGATRADSWVDIEGGAGTLFAYASLGRRELPSGNLIPEGDVIPLGPTGAFAGGHILVPRRGVAVHINAFNFPVWGMLEKFAPNFLAGMPCIVKPGSSTSYVTEAAVRLMQQSGLLPEGSLQLVIGRTGDLLDRLGGQDIVTFTGSAATAAKLRVTPNLVANSVMFNAEADSLNCAILAPDVMPDDAEFDLFVKEVVREMTTKAGQKCTAIRRVLVPADKVDAVTEKLISRLAKTRVGDPAIEGVRMGALASHDQQRDVRHQVEALMTSCERVYGGAADFAPLGEGASDGAFFEPTLLLCRDPDAEGGAHDIEAFGPVSTLMPYRDIDHAIELAARGKGSLVSSVITRSPELAARIVPALASWHGRVHILDAEAATESTGHGSPLPMLKHGGPGRAGGGEELGGIRAVKHYLQRTAVQGSPTMLTAVTGEYVRGGQTYETEVHPFRRHFEELKIGESLLTHRRTVTEADIVNFGCLSGDHFYMHFDELAARDSQFEQRIAHGYFVLSAAAGLFVSPGVGPVLANYGLDNLRFVNPVGIGDTIQARLTCKRKIDQGKESPKGDPQGVVAWDVQVTNQQGGLVASYDILTLVKKLGVGN